MDVMTEIPEAVTTMNPEAKARWVEALRHSGLRQTVGTFYSRRKDAYCALGLLCAANEQPTHVDRDEVIVENWEYVESVLPKPAHVDVYMMNDAKKMTFPEIAAWVEENL